MISSLLFASIAALAPQDLPAARGEAEQAVIPPTVPRLPQPSGRYAVGTVFVGCVDGARNDRVLGNGPRQIVAQVWYPAASRSRSTGVPYLKEELRQAMMREGYQQRDPEAIDAWEWVPTSAGGGLPVLRTASPLPVVTLSHELGIARVNYTALGQELASHGFAVIAIDHPYGGLTVLSNGQVLSLSQSPILGDALGLEELVSEWAQDIRVLLDRLSVRSQWMLAGKLDFEKVVTIGHSLGAAAALEAACLDDRIVATVCLQGVPVEHVKTRDQRPPTLVIAGGPALDETMLWNGQRFQQGYGAYFWQDYGALDGEQLLIAHVRGAGPTSFTDLPFLMPPVELATEGGDRNAFRVFRSIASWTSTFAAYQLQSVDGDEDEPTTADADTPSPAASRTLLQRILIEPSSLSTDEALLEAATTTAAEVTVQVVPASLTRGPR